MRALNYLYDMKKANEGIGTEPTTIYKAIKEIEDLIQENKSLAKALEKYNEEMIKLRIENKALKESINETKKQLDISVDLINKILEK